MLTLQVLALFKMHQSIESQEENNSSIGIYNKNNRSVNSPSSRMFHMVPALCNKCTKDVLIVKCQSKSLFLFISYVEYKSCEKIKQQCGHKEVKRYVVRFHRIIAN